ncbi:VrrA/YqfQ family protein [Peribacillus alkalitolerans]|uniref:VrrA/YqfQ family protein n=1 Tax=Peribacillus alkalitolerans TaxID=1550385 RepID=UPI0013D8DDD5|nr:VrrA/YqfQ family protein [Peribacillus alkalitolerans]
MQLGFQNGPARRFRMQQVVGQHRMPQMMMQQQQHHFHSYQQPMPFQNLNHQMVQQNPFPPHNQGFQNMQPNQGFGKKKRGGKQGGLLSRLLGKNKQKAVAQMPPNLFSIPTAATSEATRSAGTATAGAGILQSLTNPGSLTTMLTNTQKVLQAVETIGPVVSQYGPLVKNIPAMWKIYQGLKDSSNNDSVTDESKNSKETIITNVSEKTHEEIVPTDARSGNPKAAIPKKTISAQKRNVRPGESMPKLFV